MRRELTGLTPRPTFAAAGGVLAVLASMGLALLPIGERWQWALAVAAPYGASVLLGVAHLVRTRGADVRPWRLDEMGLGRHRPGDDARTPRYPLDELGVVEVCLDNGTATVFDRDGFRIGTQALPALGFDLFPFWLTARQLGLTVRLVDTARASVVAASPAWGLGVHAERPATDEGDDELPDSASPAEAAFLALEARLLQAQHGERKPARRTEAAVVYGRGPERLRSVTLTVRRFCTAGLAFALVADLARPGVPFGVGWRALAAAALAAGLWTSGRLLRTRRETSALRWTVTPERIEVLRPGVGAWEVDTADIAAVVPLRGLVVDPVSGRLRPGRTVQVFDHTGRRLVSLPCDGMDRDELSRTVRGRGIGWIELGAQRTDVAGTEDPGYGLEALPDIFQQAPHGRLSVDAEGLHWFDEGAGIRLTIESEQLGPIQLHTRSGHAWVRFRDRDGDVMLEAPLRALRIARTELRETARRAGLTVVDPEYDAFADAVFHRAAAEINLDSFLAPGPGLDAAPGSGSVSVDGPREGAGRDGTSTGSAEVPRQGDGSGAARGRAPGAVPHAMSVDARRGLAEVSMPLPSSAGAVELPATLRARGASFVALPALLAVLAVVLMLPTAGSAQRGGAVMATIVVGAAVGLVLATWLDARRLRIRVGATGVCAVDRRGGTAWHHERDAVGAVGILVVDRTERLVIWSPSGSELRREYLDVDADALRDACEAQGIPWGRPHHSWQVMPPPEL